MNSILGLVFIFGASFAFDKEAWIAPLGKYAHFNDKNEIMIEADCYETPNTRLVSNLFPEPTNTNIAQAISNGQDPTQFLDPLCYAKEDPQVWKTLDNLVFSSKPCGVDVRVDIFKKISAFGNQNCDHGCDLGKIESSLQANWAKIQPFFDFLNEWIATSVNPWSYPCIDMIKTALISVRESVKGANCKPAALKTFLDDGYVIFNNDDQYVEGSAEDLCTGFKLHTGQSSKDYYKKLPQTAAGIAQVIMSNMLVVGSE